MVGRCGSFSVQSGSEPFGLWGVTPCLMNKLQTEVKSTIAKGKEIVIEDELNSLAYLKAVIKETLRLHMPATLLLPHLSMADCNI
jgi:cytochrome P450